MRQKDVHSFSYKQLDYHSVGIQPLLGTSKPHQQYIVGRCMVNEKQSPLFFTDIKVIWAE